MKLTFENGKYCGSKKAWDAKRAEILKRADNKCENCGVHNHATGYRRKDKIKSFVSCNGMALESATIDGEKLFKIVLTISHTDNDATNNENDNLLALCQMCHLRHDVKYHKRNRANTLRKKKGLDNELFPISINP